MRFQTPQFIEVEDKTFGPLTLKQFIYLAGSAGVSFILYTFLPALLAFPLMLPVAAVGLSLAFYRVNNKPFILTLEAAFRFIVGSKLYVWRKVPPKPSALAESAKARKDDDAMKGLNVPRLSESKLKEIAWSLDVHDLHERRAHESERHRVEGGAQESIPR